MRQGTGISKDLGNFKGTDNARVEKMLSEADDFAHRLKSYKKYLKEQNSATKGDSVVSGLKITGAVSAVDGQEKGK